MEWGPHSLNTFLNLNVFNLPAAILSFLGMFKEPPLQITMRTLQTMHGAPTPPPTTPLPFYHSSQTDVGSGCCLPPPSARSLGCPLGLSAILTGFWGPERLQEKATTPALHQECIRAISTYAFFYDIYCSRSCMVFDPF